MRRVAPSTIAREEIDELLAGGVAPETNILSALAQLGVRYVVQQGLEQEQAKGGQEVPFLQAGV